MNPSLEKQIPSGVADLFFNDAARKRAAENALAQTFARWGYSEIIPPMFEYYESLASAAGAELREEIYRFFDRDGRTLALRADFTIPIARIVGTKLYDRAMPLRFFYVGSVFRYEEPQAGIRREFTQAGIELIGAATPDADAEALALAVESLRALGLENFRFTLGSVAYLHALTRDLQLDDAARLALANAWRRKNISALNGLLDSLSLDPARRAALAQIPALAGDARVLDRAPAPNDDARAAIEHLRAVLARLAPMGIRDCLTIDLAENRGMAYYTGILFEAFVEGLGFSILSGGRYDNLVERFGPPLPAIGFAVGIERVLMAPRAARAQNRAGIAPDVIAQLPADFAAMQSARAAGQIVEVDVLNREADVLREFARVRGAREIFWRDGPKENL
ncbi:MAG: ATP phosphoribosyltransferase regulatory subunit [Chloroflexi bacterium]|nr:ATP phosphoribosyltransferase regulatory subunit [Chloroflexota bacterium]